MLSVSAVSHLLLVDSLLVIDPVLVAMVFDFMESGSESMKQTRVSISFEHAYQTKEVLTC
jgi:hypothetical protein